VKIVDLRTGRTLVDKLSASEVGPLMRARIRQVCKNSGIGEAAAEQIVTNYTKTGFQPFMFEVVK